MCYHTICLYSLCGHASISQRPIRNVSSCSHHFTTTTADPDHQSRGNIQATTTTTTSPLVLSFPSPQEFEFARELHHSVPASPVSPVLSKSRANRSSTASRNSQISRTEIIGIEAPIDILADYYTTLPSPTSSPPQPQLQPQPQSQPTPPCQTTQTHPLHTFTVPTLCPKCHTARLSNLARFEARAIRDSVEREGGNVWSRNGKSTAEAVVVRKKICGVNGGGSSGGGKGRLIPLICVEEGRWRGEIRQEHERGRSQGGLNKRGTGDDVGGVAVSGQNSDDIETSGGSAGAGEKWASMVTEVINSTPVVASMPALTTPPLPPASSVWSRWISRTPSPSPKPGSFTYTPATTPEPRSDLSARHKEVEDGAGSGLQSEQNRLPATGNLPAHVDSQGTWNGVVVDVTRDPAGRNVKGIQGILGWDGAVGRSTS